MARAADVADEAFLPANGNIQAEAVTPEQALRILGARPSSGLDQRPGLAASETADPEIVEMARALRHDVDLIYAFVHDEITFEPLFGASKGALGTLLDKRGNAFDQAALMVALLRESGYSASYVQGTLRLSAQQAMDWLGLEDYSAIGYLLPSGGIPMENYYFSRVDVHHVWVKVEIGGQAYVFDPSFTQGTGVAPMDLETAMGYDATSFLGAARSGSAEGTQFIQNLNRANVRAQLTDYASNLIDQIRNTTPAARLDEVIGGRVLEPAVSGLRQTRHPLRQSILAEWSGDIPQEYQTTLRVRLSGIDRTFNSSDIYGRRLTLFYNASNQPELRLDGTLLNTGSAVAAGSNQSISVTIDHPYASGGGAYGDQSGSQNISAGGAYVISNGWGNMGKGMVDRHRRLIREYRHAGLDDRSEAVLGGSLMLVSYHWIAQNSLASELSDRIAKGRTLRHHWVGIAGESGAPYVDLPFNLSSTVSLTADSEMPSAMFFSISGVGSAFEHGVIEQTQPIGAVSTVKLLDQANDLSYKIFDVTASSFGSVQPQLVGYSASELGFVQSYLNAGYRVLMPSNGDLGEAQWRGIGFLAVSSGDDRIAHIIGGGLKGGFGTQPNPADTDGTIDAGKQASDADNHDQSEDPIDLVTGDFLYASDDISVGSAGLPVGLGLQRRYNASNRFEDRGLGWGWTHNFDILATPGSNGYQGLGDDSPLDAAAAIVAAYVSLDLLKGGKSTDRLVLAAMVEKWLMDQLTDNVVDVSQPGSNQQFVRLPDGSYHASPGQAVELFQNADQTYRMRTRKGIEMRFDAEGRLATWEDPNGNQLALRYGADGLAAVTNDFGRSLTFGYVNGRLERISDDTGRQVTYAYDASGNLQTYTDPGGKQTRFVYDPATPGLLTQVLGPRRPSDPQVTNTYDSLGRVMAQRDAAGNLYQYFIAGHRTEEEDPLGGTRVWDYNAQGRAVRETDALGLSMVKRYDGEQRLIEATLPEGGRIGYEYDVWHNPLRVTTYPKPGSSLSPLVRTFTYDTEYDLPLTTTDPKGQETRYSYYPDSPNLQRLEEPTVDGRRPTTSFTYSAQGQLATLTDAEGKVSRYEYDAGSGDLIRVIEDTGGLSLTTGYGYDAVGNLTQVTDPRGHRTTSVYDTNRRLTQSQAPAPFNHIRRYAYYDDGLLERVERETGDPLNPWQTTRLTYTATGKRERVTDDEGNVTAMDYDILDRLSQVRDPEQRLTEYHYDAKGRLLEVVGGVGTSEETVTERHGYTDDGLQASATDGRGHTTHYGYDGLDRLERTTYPDSSHEQYGYDDNGNLTQYRTRDGVLISRAYDALDRVRLKQVPGETDVTYDYDLVGRTTGIGDANGDFAYDYDSAGRLEQVRHPGGRLVGYDYDASGNRTRLTYPDGEAVDYEYDALDRLERIRENGRVLAEYSHDALSRRTRLDYANGTHSEYRYEPDSDLAEIQHQFSASTLSLQYGYNRASQRTSAQISNDLFAWRPALDQTVTYTTNVLSQYTSVDGVTQSYDANGNLTGDGRNLYSYDAQNRLTAVTTPTRAIRYDYDPMGRRAMKDVAGVETHYVYDGDQVIAEYDQADQLLRRFVYGPGIDQPVAMESSGARYYYHFDGQGSVIALSDELGEMVEHYAYGPFGESRDTSTLGNPYRYTGRRLDAETGLYYYRLRYYSSELGRFLQPDPIGYGDGMNLYAYVGSDPINFVDPWGLMGADSDGWDLFWSYTFEGIGWGLIVFDIVNTIVSPTPDAGIVGAGIIGSARAARGLAKKIGTTVDDLIKSSKPGRSTKGRSSLFDRKGGIDQANKDFDALKPSSVKDIPGGRVGKLDDGRTVVVRDKSSDGRPTLEIQNGKNKTKFRFDD